MLLLLFLIALASGQQAPTACVYTQAYWLQRPAAIPPLLLCNTRWDELMRWEVPLLQDTRQQTWLDAFHQTCAATCNLARLNQSQGTVRVLAARLLDLLERGCTNMTEWSLQWRYNEPFNALVDAMRAFNRGQFGVAACQDEFAVTPFSFANRSDLFMVVLPNNETVAAGSAYFSESLANAFQIKSLFIAFVTLSLVLSAIVALMYTMLVRRRRITYHCCDPDTGEDEADAPSYLSVNPDMLSDDENSIDLTELDPRPSRPSVNTTSAQPATEVF